MNEQTLFWKKLFSAMPEINKLLSHQEGKDMPPELSKQLKAFLGFFTGQNAKGECSEFLNHAADRMQEEWNSQDASGFRDKALQLSAKKSVSQNDILDLFFTEYQQNGSSTDEQIALLKERRTVSLEKLNPDPIKNPAKELVFTSNVLLTLPPEKYMDRFDDEMKARIRLISREKQKYWFDHPILMGVDRDSNEMIYGLRGLAESFRYEKEKGTVPRDSRMTVILSLSATHDGLKSIARDYLSGELSGVDGLDDLDVFLFNEEDTKEINSVLKALSGSREGTDLLDLVFGVDGRYGRHYSFLKAVVPLWSLAVDPDKKGTFKIDLDQVFPQEELKKETGKTAFEHFMTPLWGAEGKDSQDKAVKLGMIAGALVNEKDIAKSVFTPDVPLPADEGSLTGENRVFFKQYPMALSTLAEMMTIYRENDTPDGHHTCLSRVHVTGGTNGILCSVLREKRPFTPTFIGRAEDQAYILSVLMENKAPVMRYVHEPGLIMRHDKEAFAGDSIEASKLGTWVADLLRILYFSYYAAFLPGGIEKVKEELDPFTGCFITSTPMIKIFMRLILKILEKPLDAPILMDMAETQLGPFVFGEENRNTVKDAWIREKEGWTIYYDALDILEKGIGKRDKQTLDTIEFLKTLMLKTRIR